MSKQAKKVEAVEAATTDVVEAVEAVEADTSTNDVKPEAKKEEPMFVVPDVPEAVIKLLTHVGYDKDEGDNTTGEYIMLHVNFAGVELKPILKEAARKKVVTFARVNRDKPKTKAAFHRFWKSWGAIGEDGKPLNDGKRITRTVRRKAALGGKMEDVKESIPVVEVGFNNIGVPMEYPLSTEEKTDKLLKETKAETPEDVRALIALLEAREKAMIEAKKAKESANNEGTDNDNNNDNK